MSAGVGETPSLRLPSFDSVALPALLESLSVSLPVLLGLCEALPSSAPLGQLRVSLQQQKALARSWRNQTRRTRKKPTQ